MLQAVTTPTPADIDPREFRQALSRFATGITVVSTFGPTGQPEVPFVGLTVSSFNTVSLSPPLVLWSLATKASSVPLFTQNSHYVVNVLAAEQVELCHRFAGGQGNRFANLDYTLGQTGLPLFAGALAWFECRNRSQYLEGDHIIFVGEVVSCGFIEGGQPLVFQGGMLQTTQDLKSSR